MKAFFDEINHDNLETGIFGYSTKSGSLALMTHKDMTLKVILKLMNMINSEIKERKEAGEK